MQRASAARPRRPDRQRRRIYQPEHPAEIDDVVRACVTAGSASHGMTTSSATMPRTTAANRSSSRSTAASVPPRPASPERRHRSRGYRPRSRAKIVVGSAIAVIGTLQSNRQKAG